MSTGRRFSTNGPRLRRDIRTRGRVGHSCSPKQSRRWDEGGPCFKRKLSTCRKPSHFPILKPCAACCRVVDVGDAVKRNGRSGSCAVLRYAQIGPSSSRGWSVIDREAREACRAVDTAVALENTRRRFATSSRQPDFAASSFLVHVSFASHRIATRHSTTEREPCQRQITTDGQTSDNEGND